MLAAVPDALSAKHPGEQVTLDRVLLTALSDVLSAEVSYFVMPADGSQQLFYNASLQLLGDDLSVYGDGFDN
jgi:hypothetical protein